LLENLIEAAEEGRIAAYVGRCQEAGLMPNLIKEIEKDAHFPAAAKTMLKHSLPRLAAKWLNKTGISAEFADELTCVTAVLMIIKSERSTLARFDEILAEIKKANEEKKSQEPIQPAPLAKAA
jgi:hypothetical protein